MGFHNGEEVIIGASECKFPRVYFVGPFGGRVSFASQQRRVLNLIWALTRKKILPERGARVAVIGGGIAGVTAAAALLCRSCDVHLYEREGEVLTLQSLAHHRTVHPSINFWPEEALNWTTEFPFLDWYADNAVRVAKVIERDWKGFEDAYNKFGSLEDWLSGLHVNTPVSGFDDDDGRPIVLVDGKPHDTFDLVLVTTGFGFERNLGDEEQKRYWTHDDIDLLSLRTGLKIAVSGTGDGGIIDALRLTYTKFMEHEVALRLIQLESKDLLTNQIRDIEAKAQDIADLNERSVHYAEEYGKIVGDRSLRAKAMLPDLAPDKIPVTLIGPRPHPFDLGSAPIHKLALAYSLAKKRIVYLQGTLTRPDKWVLTPPTGAPYEVSFDRIIVRHGSDAPAKIFLGETEAEKLEKAQRMIGDFLPSGSGPTSEFYANQRIYPPRATPRFAMRRLLPANEFLKRFGLNAELRRCDDGDYVFLATKGREPVKNAEHLPSAVFGIELIRSREIDEVADPLLGVSR
jgi:hypothetical protein